MSRLPLKLTSDKENREVLSRIECEYTQDSDCCSPNTDYVNIMTINSEREGYYVLKTERWSFNNREDLIKIIDDFLGRFEDIDVDVENTELFEFQKLTFEEKQTKQSEISKKVKFCSMMNEQTITKLKAISAQENVSFTDLLELACNKIVKEYEKLNGEIKMQPKKTAESIFKK